MNIHKRLYHFFIITSVMSIASCSDSVKDIDGTRYKTVKIGDHVWMAENLNVSRFRNGDPIPEVISNGEWRKIGDEKKPAWSYYDSDTINIRKYGKLYNWYAVNDPRGLCPEGWHVPSDYQWHKMINYLGGWFVAGAKMKSTFTEPDDSHPRWERPNTSATNESAFSGLPGGYRTSVGSFSFIGIYGNWWSSTEFDTNRAWAHSLVYDDSGIIRYHAGKQRGYSVRCLKTD